MPIQARRLRPAGIASGNSFSNIALWLLFAVIGLTALTLVFVHAPERIKLIGLYGVAYGLIAGWGLGLLAAKFHLPCTILSSTMASLLIIIGGMGLALESHRIWAASQ